ncbi:uncharacterized protein LOC107040615 [Diachasma alloeum]|uniref:uncharacterized protein LOC107040615 n=1 Tax=Diachasma alloeum TaxID=454923 RepID=UPI000738395C|nr:uncharacterized protein LOC107040615 [Diachasma alloeum]
MENNFLFFGILFLTCSGITGLIIPEELPTILSLIYSHIPPIRTGTDSKLGVGFRLGQHADFQTLVELGPQIETEKTGPSDSKQRRQAMLDAAIRGDMGPLTKSIAEFNIAKMKQKQEVNLKYIDGKKDDPDDWLRKWSKEIAKAYNSGIPPRISKIQRIRM